MPLELVSEEDMATKSKKIKFAEKVAPKAETKKMDIVITKKNGLAEEEKIEEKIEKLESGGSDVGSDIQKKVLPTQINPNLIVKRIYFPGDTYSKKENQNGFKKILSKYGLAWYKPMMKTYTSKEGIRVLTGMYVSDDQNKKVFCIYEGSSKPTTAIIKIMGSGGNFLIELMSFCHNIGCIIEDKDEQFVNNTLLTLQETGEIYVEKKLETEKLQDYEKILEEKIKKLVDEYLQKYIDVYKDSFEKQGISLDTVKFFKRKEIEQNVKWSLERGYIS